MAEKEVEAAPAEKAAATEAAVEEQADAFQTASGVVRLAGSGGKDLRPAHVLALQRTAGNRALQHMMRGAGRPAVPVQRWSPSLSGLKKAVGLTKKPKLTPTQEAAETGARSRTAKVVTVGDLQKQVDLLETANAKLNGAREPGNSDSQKAAFEIQKAAERILGNLPDQDSKASKVLGRMYPDQIKRLRRIVEDTGLILDEFRVEQTRKQAQDIYHQAGQSGAVGQPGALTKLTARRQFDALPEAPAPNAQVTAYLQAKGFTSYEQAYDDALAQSAADPRSRAEMDLERMQRDLFLHAGKAKSRSNATAMGISAAELAAIQTFTLEDYRYINPATANDDKWMKATHADIVDDPQTMEDWGAVQDSLAAEGQTLEQRWAKRQSDLASLREEGTLHSGVAMQGLVKMPVWAGTGYRGERLREDRFGPRFEAVGDTFRPREPTFTWKTITSISKDSGIAQGFMGMGTGNYQLLWKFEVINARDIEPISLARREREVALLPGAEFAYGDIKVIRKGDATTPWMLEVTARQVK